VLRHKRNVLLIGVVSELGRVGRGVLSVFAMSGFASILALHIPLVQNHAFWVVEHLGKKTPLGSFNGLGFLEFIQGLLAFLMRYYLFSALFSFCVFDSLVNFSVVLLCFHVV